MNGISDRDLYATEESAHDKMATLNVRVPTKLRDDFAALCKSKNIEMSKVIRRFLEGEIAKINS